MIDLASDNNLYEKNYDLPSFVWKKHKNLGYPLHFHSAMEIYFILNGQMKTIINGQEYLFSAGDISIINPYELHSYIKSGEADVAVLILSNHYLVDFDSEYPEKLIPSALKDTEYNRTIYKLLKDVPASVHDNKTISMLSKKGLANLILDKIVTHYGVIAQTQSSTIIADILKYAQNNYKNKITLDDLAKQFGYAKNSMSRILTKYLGVDWRIFVNNLRAEQVRLMLKKPEYNDLSVLKIAYFCGFESATTFYRTYKRQYGQLPSKRK